MNVTSLFIIEAVVFTIFIFLVFLVVRELLFFGFAPFMPSRPELMEKIMGQITIRDNYTIYSLGYGQSGFLYSVEKDFPNAKLIGVDDSLWHCLIARLQILLRHSRIKIKYSGFYQVSIRRANIIYCHVDVSVLREIYKKLRVESKAGAVVISSGFVIPYLEPIRILKSEPEKRWFRFLVGSAEKVLTEKQKEYKPDNNIYYYEV